MKILTNEQMLAADQQTIQEQGITSWDQMEKASSGIFAWIKKNLPNDNPYHIYAGVGNNGGDGLALARMLSQAGKKVKVTLVPFSEIHSEDFTKNLELLKQLNTVEITSVSQPETSEDFLQANDKHFQPLKSKPAKGFEDFIANKYNGNQTIIIDAIFGIGLSRRVSPWVQRVFEEINRQKGLIISIDVPSGIYLGEDRDEKDIFVTPHVVLTFFAPKLAFLLPQIGRFIPYWEIINLPLSYEFLKEVNTEYDYTTEKEIKRLLRTRHRFTHKGTYGHALVVGGSYGKVGAAVLSGKATLRSGAGLLTLLLPKCGYNIAQTVLPEAMVLTSSQEEELAPTDIPFSPNAIGIGIGMGTSPSAQGTLASLLRTFANVPFVIDADALNLVASSDDLLRALPKNTILTPHPKELERLIGKWTNDFDRQEKAKEFAKKHKVILILKGAFTMITDGEHFWVNSTGNPALATAGSGDVLTGVITGLLSQGYTPLNAAIVGVYIHGKAADTYVRNTKKNTMIASDIIDFLQF